MTTINNERAYTSDGEAWAVFVGDITPEEFVKPFLESSDPVDAAIKNHMSDWGWEEEPPSWLPSALYRYVSGHCGNMVLWLEVGKWVKQFA